MGFKKNVEIITESKSVVRKEKMSKLFEDDKKQKIFIQLYN